MSRLFKKIAIKLKYTDSVNEIPDELIRHIRSLTNKISSKEALNGMNPSMRRKVLSTWGYNILLQSSDLVLKEKIRRAIQILDSMNDREIIFFLNNEVFIE